MQEIATERNQRTIQEEDNQSSVMNDDAIAANYSARLKGSMNQTKDLSLENKKDTVPIIRESEIFHSNDLEKLDE